MMADAPQATLRPIHILLLAGMLVVSLAAAVLVWWTEVGREEALAQAAFERNADLAFGAVKARLETLQAVMRSGAAFLARHPEVDGNEWRGFVDRSQLTSAYPGVDGVAVAVAVPRAATAAFVADIRKRLWRHFTIRPEDGADPAMVVIVVQPQARQDKLLGLDLASQPLRRQVAEQAVESGQASLSAPLAPLGGAVSTHDFLMAQPVFRPDYPLGTPAQRKVALWGWMLMGLRVQALIDDALTQVDDPLFDIDVYYGAVAGENKIYDGRRHWQAPGGGLTTVRALDVAGSRWSLAAHRHLPIHALWFGRAPVILLAVSIGFGLTLTAAAALLIISREQSRLLALQAMGQLSRAEWQLAGITATVPGTVFQWVRRSQASGFTFLSAQARQMFGLDPETAIADWRRLPFIAADLARWPEAMARAADSDGEWRMEGRYRGADGALRWWSATGRAAPAEDGWVAVNGIFVDITDRKDSERALAERELTYRDMFLRTSAVGVLIDPGTGRVADANPAAQAYYGLPLTALRDMDIHEVSRMDHQAVTALLADCADGDQRFYRSRHRLASGEVREVEVHMGPVRVHGQQFVHAIVHDVTDRERFQAQLQDKTAKLEASNAELEQFSYVASHDLQEPLRTIASFLQLIDRRYHDTLDDDGREFIGFAVEAATRLQAMIRDLLDYSRIGTRGNPFAVTNMVGVVRVVCDNLARSIAESGAEIRFDDLPQVWADQRQMVSLLQNLVGNALKYRQPDRPLVVRIDARPDGADWVFSVADNGIGIEAEYFERIFLVFQRLHTRDKYEGTGIGLALCRKIVHRHGGEIWVESVPGQGTTFLFRLPGAAGHAPSDPHQTELAAGHAPSDPHQTELAAGHAPPDPPQTELAAGHAPPDPAREQPAAGGTPPQGDQTGDQPAGAISKPEN